MRNIYNCNVAVVGGAGFLGSHLVRHLVEDRNCKVLVVDNLVSGKKEFLPRDEAVTFFHLDITDNQDNQLYRLFVSNDTRYVFNYAAYPYIPVSFSRPEQVFAVNAFGALRVIEAAYSAGCEAILQVSSAEIYGRCQGKINEESEVHPHSTYGASKVAIDMLLASRYMEAQVPTIGLRQFNCIGERETHPYILPECISQVQNYKYSKAHHLRSKEIVKLSLGNNSSRDFMYAGDAVRYAAELLENGTFGEVYNLGSEETIKIYDLAEKVGKMMGYDNVEVTNDVSRNRPWEIWHLLSDNTKINSVVEYRSKISLDRAIQKTINYFLSNGCKWCWE